MLSSALQVISLLTEELGSAHRHKGRLVASLVLRLLLSRHEPSAEEAAGAATGLQAYSDAPPTRMAGLRGGPIGGPIALHT